MSTVVLSQLNRNANVPVYIRQYRIISKIGSGSFGDIFLAVNETSGQRVALKLERNNVNRPQLHFEYRLYNCLLPAVGIPRVHHFFAEPKYNVMAMDLLGPSLEDLFNFCSRRFSLKTVLMLAFQMIERIEYVHLKSYLHRDIKPENFLVGADSNQLFIIDFGLAKEYYDSARHEHIPFKWGNRMTGTARYASINALLGFELGRRDDMEALGYVLIYFLRGSLPWQGLSGPRHQKYEMLAEKKQSIKPEELCKGFPDEFAAYLIYCRNIRFEKQPNYLGLRRSFSDLFNRLRYVQDGIYDWRIIKDHSKVKKKPPDGGVDNKKQIEASPTILNKTI
ncbi:casein kinase I [Drosophila hydei]|uniref:non-specific serine/threonine protein kinase n=1 Tax=Drosophila hydei TaxID=7224 RepID=A0A6J1LMA3_DROHY|nr:casein kinase I [Drosophila hydei]